MMFLGINNKYLFSIILSVKKSINFLNVMSVLISIFLHADMGLTYKYQYQIIIHKKQTIVCIYKATIFAWKELKLHYIIILTIAVLAAILIKLNIDGWSVIYVMALLCVFIYLKQQHHDQSSSLLHASWKAGFTEDGPWTPCKDKTGWINTSFDGNIIATIYRTEEICFGNRLHMQLGVRKIWAGTLDSTGSHM